ncbi:signal peptidase I [Haloplanus rubicundus]|uniref:Signal peptidase I n=1 Tax=Haloplanus rubicundus TaxID=1547898 RepID=A0A345EDL1_9EURY|nr:signal peptidase I [Haloplanus rubicundus]AXG10283.1 signal peptidase I [Haloplanus rubicundus]
MNHTIRQTLRPPTVGRALLAVVLLALIAPFVVYAVPATVGAEASYVVLTASMTPAIAPGDVVIVDSVPARDIAVGDVIVFEQRAGDAIPITHRVIGVERSAGAPPAFQTKGDANEDADLTPVTPDRVIGRVVFSIPLIGHVIQFVGTPAGFVALVVLPLGLLVVSEVADLLRAGRSGAAASDAADADAPTDSDAAVATTATATDPVPDDQVVFTPADLTLSSVALGAFTVYAGYVAFGTPTAVSVTLAIAVGALFLLAVALRLFAPFDAATAADRLTVAPTVRIGDGRPTGPTVDVATPADLSAIAATLGRPLLRDDRDRYVVLDGAVTYACDVPTGPDDASAEVDAIERHLGPTGDADAGVPMESEPLPSAPVEPRSAGR